MPAARLQRAVAAGFGCWALARMAAADSCRHAEAQSAALMALTPPAAATAWLAALMFSDRRARLVAACAAAALSSAVIPRAVPRTQPRATGPVLRVMTVNMMAGRAAADNVAELVRRAAADVLFVQELKPGTTTRLRRAGLEDLLPHVANDNAVTGARGNAIYSRFPLSGFPSVPAMPSAQPTATLTLPGGTVRLVCVHLNAPAMPWSMTRNSPWRAQLRALTSLRLGDPPLIVAGDFNATVDHAGLRDLLGQGLVDAASEAGKGLVPTWGLKTGGRRVLLTIDHILADDRCAILSVAVYNVSGSDHRAVLASVRLPGEQQAN